jgi:hypothetical protein
MEKVDRDRLRVDQEFQAEITRQAVKNIKWFEETLSNLKDTSYQRLLV